MDANDKEKYDNILNKIEQNMYHIEHNEQARLSLNNKLITKINKEIVVLNKYKNNINKINNFTDIALTKLIYHDLLAILNLIDSQISDIEYSLEQCKLGITHPSILTTDELKQLRIPFKEPITQNVELNWLLSSTFCSLSGNGLIYYFIKIPLKALPRTTYYSLSYPIKRNSKVLTIKVKEHIVIRYKNSFYNGECVKFNSHHYCKNIVEIKDKCIIELSKNIELRNCNLVEIKNDSFIKLIPTLHQYLFFNVTSIKTSISSKVQIHELPNTCLINLSENEQFINVSAPLTYMDNINIPLISSYAINNKDSINTNLTFEELQQIDVGTIEIETLEPYDVTFNQLLVYIFYAICMYLLCFHLYKQYVRIKILCSQSATLSSTTQDPQDPIPEQPQFEGRAQAWLQYLQNRRSN